MTTFRQIEANRLNALKSTGPTTSDGKDRSRRNALRHGLSAETVVTPIEDIEDYQAFEAGVIADYDAQTAVERELVLRLASLLWRLRRATSIETGLLQIQAELLPENDHISQLNYRGNSVKAETAAGAQAHPHDEITQCFLHLANTDGPAFERVRRYETMLWRQLRQTLFTLKLLAWQKREMPLRSSKQWRRFNGSS